MDIYILIAVINLALCVLLFFYFRLYMKHNSIVNEQLAEQKIEIQRLIADIDIATDRDSLLVEERIKTLKNLLDDADKKISVYVKELERGRAGDSVYAKLGRTSAVFPAVQEENKDAASETAKHEPGAADKPAAKQLKTKAESPQNQKPDIRVQIAELAAKGNDPVKIAAKLKISVSEVDLALSLLGR